MAFMKLGSINKAYTKLVVVRLVGTNGKNSVEQTAFESRALGKVCITPATAGFEV